MASAEELEQLADLLDRPLAHSGWWQAADLGYTPLWDVTRNTQNHADPYNHPLYHPDTLQFQFPVDAVGWPGQPLPVYHLNGSPQESTMDWCLRHLRIHYFYLRYACVFYRYYLLTSTVTLYVVPSPWFNPGPPAQRRASAKKSWELAQSLFRGRHGMELERGWGNEDNWRVVDEAMILETVRLHTSPQKINPDSINAD